MWRGGPLSRSREAGRAAGHAAASTLAKCGVKIDAMLQGLMMFPAMLDSARR